MADSVSTIAEMETLRQERDDYRDAAEARDVALTEYFENDARDNRVEGLRAASRIVAAMYAGEQQPTIDGKLASAEDMTIILAKPLAKYLEGE